jgi:hypothetical protein
MRKLEGLDNEILVELNYLKNVKRDSLTRIVRPSPLPHSHTPGLARRGGEGICASGRRRF